MFFPAHRAGAAALGVALGVALDPELGLGERPGRGHNPAGASGIDEIGHEMERSEVLGLLYATTRFYTKPGAWPPR